MAGAVDAAAARCGQVKCTAGSVKFRGMLCENKAGKKQPSVTWWACSRLARQEQDIEVEAAQEETWHMRVVCGAHVGGVGKQVVSHVWAARVATAVRKVDVRAKGSEMAAEDKQVIMYLDDLLAGWRASSRGWCSRAR